MVTSVLFWNVESESSPLNIIYHHRTQGEEPESIHILAIVNALKTLGNEVFIVGPSKKDLRAAGSNARLLARIKHALPSLLFEIAQILYNVVVYQRLSRAVRQHRPDFIYERYAPYNFAGILASKRHGIPLILEVNTPYAYAWSKYYRIHFPSIARAVEKWVIGNASRVITVTQVQKNFLSEHYIEPKKVVVCQNAIDPVEFDCEVDPFYLPLLDGKHGTVVGFVGTMNRWQGIPVFRDVIPRVLSRNPNIVFLMVGDGEFRQELEHAVRIDGVADRVIFTGRVAHAHIPSLIRHMDIAVLPDSNAYGSPMKIFEYMAMAKAIIAPRVPPVEEIMTNGETGFIVIRGDAEALTENILLLAGDAILRRQLGENARRYVLANHTWLANAQVIVDIYQDLMHHGQLSRGAKPDA